MSELMNRDPFHCAICKRPVACVLSVYDHVRCLRKFRFYCHGRVQEAYLTQEEIEYNRVTITMCFEGMPRTESPCLPSEADRSLPPPARP